MGTHRERQELQPDCPDKCPRTEDSRPLVIRWLLRCLRWFAVNSPTIVIAIATAVIAVVGIYQWRVLSGQLEAASEANSLARDTARIELRAYVSASPFAIIHIEDGMPEAFIRVENTGRTPAKIIERSAGIAVRSPISVNELENIGPTTKEDGIITLNAGGSDRIDRVYSRTLMPHEIDAIKSTDGPLRIYVHGRIVYQDVFNNTHTVPFCHMYFGYKTQKFPIGDGRSTSVGYPGTEAYSCEQR